MMWKRIPTMVQGGLVALGFFVFCLIAAPWVARFLMWYWSWAMPV